MKSFVRVVSTAVVLGAVVVLAGVGPADAGRPLTVRCVGTEDYCGAAVSIAGGKQSRVVTINLTGTNVKLMSMSAIPAASRGSFLISEASYKLGGSQFRFRLNTVRTNPRRARIILTFAAGTRVGKLGGADPGLRGTETATATFSVGYRRIVTIVGGGAGTSLCTADETNTWFETNGDDEPHSFGFYAKSGGSCLFQSSWSDFKVTVRDGRSGGLVGQGIMSLRLMERGYGARCVSERNGRYEWEGLVCDQDGRGVKIHL
jgi:hypothetical protein